MFIDPFIWVKVSVIGDEQARLCCFLVNGDGVVLVEDDGEEFCLFFVSLVERRIVWWRWVLVFVVAEDKEEEEGVDKGSWEELNWVGKRRPSPIPINTELISKIPRASERSFGVEHVEVEEEEEPVKKKLIDLNY